MINTEEPLATADAATNVKKEQSIVVLSDQEVAAAQPPQPFHTKQYRMHQKLTQ